MSRTGVHPPDSVSHHAGRSGPTLQDTPKTLIANRIGPQAMEAASRPSLMPLTDLPVEEPIALPQPAAASSRASGRRRPRGPERHVNADGVACARYIVGGGQDSAAPVPNGGYLRFGDHQRAVSGPGRGPRGRETRIRLWCRHCPLLPTRSHCTCATFAPAAASRTSCAAGTRCVIAAHRCDPGREAPMALLRTTCFAPATAPVVTTASGAKSPGDPDGRWRDARRCRGRSPPMDRDFIARNQIVERYLSGRLPLKGATDFERFCRENPQAAR